MPNPAPAKVAAGVTTEDVRRAYYDDADWDEWITEFHIDPLQLIVCDDRTGKYKRVPVTVVGEDDFEFGDPIDVVIRYIDAGQDSKVAAAAAQAVPATRVVFASRAESRPGTRPKAADPQSPADTVTGPAQPDGPPEPDPAPADPEPTPEDVPTSEPGEPNTSTEDPVSDLSDIARGLGLPDDAGKDAILAALAERKPTEPEPTTEPEPDAQPEPEPEPTQPDPALIAAAAEYATEVKRLSSELAEIKAREAAGVKRSIFDAAVKAGKLRPADRASWEARYDKAPEVITDILASIEEGSAVPVVSAGYTGTGDESLDLEVGGADYNRLFGEKSEA